MTHADASIARQMAAARARRRPPQGLGAVAQDRLGWIGCDRTALRHDLWQLTIQLRTAHEAGRLPVVADSGELTERALRTIDGVVGILWCRAPRAWAAAARRPFRLAWVLCDTRRGAASLHRQLGHAGRTVAPAARTRYLALQIDGQRTWGWAVPLVLGIGDAPWGQRWGYWDAPALASQSGVMLARRLAEARAERDAAPRQDDDDDGNTANWLFAAADRAQEDTPLDAEHALRRADLATLSRDSDAAIEDDLAHLERELLTQWAAHGIDFTSPAVYLAWSQACKQAKRAGQATPPPPAIAHYRAAAAAARRDRRPRPVHPSVAFSQRQREAVAEVAAQASDAELAWHGRGADERPLPEDHAALVAQIRRERAALWAGWDREPEADLVAEGRRSRTVAQAKALSASAAVESLAVAEELAARRR